MLKWKHRDDPISAVIDLGNIAMHDDLSNESFIFAHLSDVKPAINKVTVYGYDEDFEVSYPVAVMKNQPLLIQIGTLRALFSCNKLDHMYRHVHEIELHLSTVMDKDQLRIRTKRFMSLEMNEILYGRSE